MYVIINDQLKVSVTDNEDAAELLAGDNGSIMQMDGEFEEEHLKLLTNIFQAVVDETVLILDSNRQRIELANQIELKPKKSLN